LFSISLGYFTTHGGSYVDRNSGITRQYDIRAAFTIEDKFSVELAIECKCLKSNFPLLISRIPRSREESFNEVIISKQTFKAQSGRAGGMDAMSGDSVIATVPIRIGGVNSLYVPNAYVGKSTSQVGRSPDKKELISNDSAVFSKWSQALASANDLVQRACDGEQIWHGRPPCTIVIPILVLSDSNLWVADYSENGSKQGRPHQTDEAEIFIDSVYGLPNTQSRYTISHLHVYTKSGAHSFLTKLMQDDVLKTTLKMMASQ
jgi:hypothetical protein